MLGKKSYIFSSADLKTINEYSEISVIEEDEEESRITIKGESNNFDNICLCSGERGRVIVIIEPRADYIDNTDRADYTDYLLFSPTLEIESSTLISDIVISGDSIEFLVKKVMKIISDFRVKLLKKLYSCKKTFNSNFRMICKAKSDFFDCCEEYCEEYCDLSIFVIERWIKNINKMSEILKRI